MGIPDYMRSDNGPEFVSKEVGSWLAKVGTGTLYIEPGSPGESGYCESFNGKLCNECLNGEIFYSWKEAQIVIEKWRVGVKNASAPPPPCVAQTNIHTPPPGCNTLL